jgi:dihydrofolate reductase
MHVIVSEYLSGDGVMQAPGHAAEDLEGGFSHGGWTGPHMADHRRVFSETFAASGGFLLGRRTYEIFASYWPTVEDPNDGVARAFNDLPKYVVSSTLEDATWRRTTIISDAATEIPRLKESPGKPLRVIGSSRLVQYLVSSISLTSISFGFIPSCSVAASASLPRTPRSVISS